MAWGKVQAETSGEASLDHKWTSTVEGGLGRKLGAMAAEAAKAEADAGAPSTAPSAAPATDGGAAAPQPPPEAAAAPSASAAAPAAQLPKPAPLPKPAAPLYKPPPAPPGKSYLPTFIAPEAYGKKKNESFATIRQEAEQKVAREAAKKEKERLARRKKRKGEEVVAATTSEDDSEYWQLMFMIVLGVFVALSEALDLDVLIGILLAPFMSFMKYLADEFDNVNLDPQTWMDAIGHGYNHMCKEAPGGFIIVDLTIFVIGVV